MMTVPYLRLVACFVILLINSLAGGAPLLAQQVVWPMDDGIDEGDDFGRNITMDGEWAAGGAPKDRRDGISNVGAVYVMQRVGGGWTIHTKLMPTKDQQSVDARFGHSVALRGHQMAVVSCMPFPLSPPFTRGVKVSIFQLVAGSWELAAELTPPLTWTEKATVVLGEGRLVVSSRQGTSFQPVVSYRKGAAGWEMEQVFSQVLPGSLNTSFGESLALEGNVLLIGCPAHRRVYEYRFSEGAWAFKRFIMAEDSYSEDGFGICVKLLGSRALVGASRPPAFQRLTGSKAYLYEVAESGWTLLRAFGGDNTLKVQDDTDMALSVDRALVIGREGTNTVTELQITAQPPANWILRSLPLTRFQGYPITSVATHGDLGLVGYDKQTMVSSRLNGKLVALAGSPDLMAGEVMEPQRSHQQLAAYHGFSLDMQGDRAVYGESSSSGYETAVHVAERREGVWHAVKSFDSLSPEIWPSRFGSVVAVDGKRVAVADPRHYSDSPAKIGRVYIYERTGDGWPDLPTITIQSPVNDSSAGSNLKLALSGDRLAVSESFYNERAGLSTARVRLYRLSDGQAEPAGVLERQGNTDFGHALAMEGETLAISDPKAAAIGKAPHGEVLIYSLSAGSPQLITTLRSKRSFELGEFGGHLQLSGKVLVVAGATNAGCWLETFGPSGRIWAASAPVLQPRLPFNQTALIAMSLDGDHLLLTLGETLSQLYQKRPSGWVFLNSSLTPESTHSTLRRHVIHGGTIAESGSGITIRSASQIVAADGALAAERTSEVNKKVIELGELLVGVDTVVRLPLQNRGILPLRITELRNSHVSNSLKKVEFKPITLAPGESTVVLVTLNPPAPGQYATYLEIVHDRPELGAHFLGFAHTVTSTASPPGIEQPEPARLAVLGEEVLLAPAISGTRGYTCQWAKDGRALTGQTQPILFIPQARSADAGRYRLTAKRSGFEPLVCDVLLGVYDRQYLSRVVSDQEPLKYQQSAWGPGIRVRWNVDESWAARGTQTPSIQVRDATFLPGYPEKVMEAQVVLGGTSATGTQVTFQIIAKPKQARLQDFLPVFLVDQEMDVFFGDLIGNQYDTVDVQGLPPGLTYLPENYQIRGTATVLGFFPLTLRVKTPGYPVQTFVRPLQVVSDYREVEVDYGNGSGYAGLVSVPDLSQQRKELPALVRIKLTRGKGFSGEFSMGSLKRRFAAKWVKDEAAGGRMASIPLAPFVGFRDVRLSLVQHTSEAIVAGLEVTGQNSDEQAFSNPMELWLEMPASGYAQTSFPGRYNFLLRSIGSLYADMPPVLGGLGTGFGAIIISPSMTASVAGTLPDGTGVTFAAPILRSSLGAEYWQLHLLAYTAAGGHVSGSTAWEPRPIFSEQGGLHGEFIMSRPSAVGSRLYPDGIHSERLQVQGAHYYVPAGMQSVPDPESGRSQALLSLQNEDLNGEQPLLGTVLIDVTVRNDLSVAVPAQNPHKLRLDVYRPTGFFTGSITLNDLLPGSNTRRQKRVVNFRGMIIPGIHRGGGLFHLQQLANPYIDPPVTSANALIHTGSVTLE